MAKNKLAELLLYKDELLSSADDQLLDSISITEKFIFDALTSKLGDMELSGGKFISSQSIAGFSKEIYEAFENSPLPESVSVWLQNFDEIEKLNKQISGGLHGVDLSKVSVAKEKKAIIAEVTQSLSKPGLKTNIVQPINTILTRHITLGTSVNDAEEALKAWLVSNPDKQGNLSRYVKQVSMDAINQYDGAINSKLAQELDMDHFAYVGSLIKTSRPNCQSMLNPQGKFGDLMVPGEPGIFPMTAIPEIVKRAKGGAGWNAATTPETFFIYRMGFNCRHMVQPMVLDEQTLDVIKEALKPSKESLAKAKAAAAAAAAAFKNNVSSHLSKYKKYIKEGKDPTPGMLKAYENATVAQQKAIHEVLEQKAKETALAKAEAKKQLDEILATSNGKKAMSNLQNSGFSGDVYEMLDAVEAEIVNVKKDNLFKSQLSKYKKAKIEGKTPSPGQIAAFESADAETKFAIQSAIDEATGLNAAKVELGTWIKGNTLEMEALDAFELSTGLSYKDNPIQALEYAKKYKATKNKNALKEVDDIISKNPEYSTIFETVTDYDDMYFQLVEFKAKIKAFETEAAKFAAQAQKAAAKQVDELAEMGVETNLDAANKIFELTSKNKAYKKIYDEMELPIGATSKDELLSLNAEINKYKKAKQKSSDLSSAKKKLLEGKKINSGEKKAIGSLTDDEFNKWAPKVFGDDLPDIPDIEDALAAIVNSDDYAPIQNLIKGGGSAAAKKAVSNTTAAINNRVTPGFYDVELSDFERIGEQRGSNTGGLFRHRKTGEEFYIKEMGVEQANNEVLASKLYELAGIDVPQVMTNGKGRVYSRFNPNVKTVSSDALSTLPGTYEGFATDAWLANWDTVGLSFDNLLANQGRAIRIDVGGSLAYRAQGTRKGAAWGNSVKEIDSLRDAGTNPQSAKVFGGMSKDELDDSVRRVLKISDDDIERVVKSVLPPSEADDMVTVLIARKNDLKKKFPHLVEKKKPAPKPITGKKEISDAELNEIKEARANGWTRLTDKDSIEDNNVLFWHEVDDAGDVWTGANLRLRSDLSPVVAKLEREMWQNIDNLSRSALSTTAPDTFYFSMVDDSFLSSIKGILGPAKSGGAIRTQDVLRVQNARKRYDDVVSEFKDHISAGKLTKAQFDKWDKQVRPFMDAMEAAVKPGVGNAPAVSKLEKLGMWKVPDPLKFKVPKGAKPKKVEQKWKVRNDIEQKFAKKGVLKRGSGTYNNELLQYIEKDIGGARVRYWHPDLDNGKTMKGQLEILVKGNSKQAADKAIEVLEEMGINAARATAADLEERYLRQIATSRGLFAPSQDLQRFKDATLNANISKAKTQEERIELLAKAITKDAKLSKDVRKMPGYNYMGIDEGFGQNRRVYNRPDLSENFKDRIRNDEFVFHHSTGESPDSLLKILIDDGGHLGTKKDLQRRGKNFQMSGMSPTADMKGGGSAYLYTTGKRTTDYPSVGFTWDSSVAMRVDARLHVGDEYGALKNRIPVRGTAEIPQLINNYETIFKNGISLYKHNFTCFVNTPRAKRDLIDWLKAQGGDFAKGKWPDGRDLNDVIRTTTEGYPSSRKVVIN